MRGSRSTRCRPAFPSRAWARTRRATPLCSLRGSSRSFQVVLDRYTRPEMGAGWTDAARMEFWRQVEVAVAEETDGPTAQDLEGIRNVTLTVEAVGERDKVTDHDMAAFVDVLSASAG